MPQILRYKQKAYGITISSVYSKAQKMIRQLKRRWKQLTAILSLFTFWQSEIIPIVLQYVDSTTQTTTTKPPTPRNSNATRKLAQDSSKKRLCTGRANPAVLLNKRSAKTTNTSRNNLAHCHSNPGRDRKQYPRHNQK
jgi:hypothetical protein